MGVLAATGRGKAMLSVGEGIVEASCSCDLWVSENAQVEIEGTSEGVTSRNVDSILAGRLRGGQHHSSPGNRQVRAGRGGFLYKDTNGRVTITGKRFVATLKGEISDLRVQGSGLAILEGEGTFTVARSTGETSGEWAADSR